MSRWLLWLAAACALAGCQRSAALPTADSARPALWRAVRGDRTLWLFGTIHLLPPGVRWQDGPVAQAIRTSDALVTEIPAGDPQAQAAAFLGLARAEGLPPLAERLPDADRPALAVALARTGVPATVLDRMTSWGAALTLAASAGRIGGATREAAPEAVLARAFAGKPQTALEDFTGQLAIFATLSEAAQRQLLAQSVREVTRAEPDYAKLLSAWRSGDAAGLSAIFDSALAGAPELRTALVTRRNRAWADMLAARPPGTTLVAVGAGHLLGSEGLPALLSARGFRVARMQ